MKEFFVPEDFKVCINALPSYEQYIQYAQSASDIANAKLKRESRVVYGKLSTGVFVTNDMPGIGSTHTALLVCIEPIAKCDHKINNLMADHHIIEDDYTFRCKCGVKVKRVITYEEIS